MMRPTTLSASFAMVSPMYALPRLSGTCTLYQLLAFQPSTLLPTCFFFAIISPVGISSRQGTCVLCYCQVHQIIVHGCNDRTELRARDRGNDPVAHCNGLHAAQVVGRKRRGNIARVTVPGCDLPSDLHASASCQPFAKIPSESQGMVAPARRLCPPPLPPQAAASSRTFGPSSSVLPAGERTEILHALPLFAYTSTGPAESRSRERMSATSLGTFASFTSKTPVTPSYGCAVFTASITRMWCCRVISHARSMSCEERRQSVAPMSPLPVLPQASMTAVKAWASSITSRCRWKVSPQMPCRPTSVDFGAASSTTRETRASSRSGSSALDWSRDWSMKSVTICSAPLMPSRYG